MSSSSLLREALSRPDSLKNGPGERREEGGRERGRREGKGEGGKEGRREGTREGEREVGKRDRWNQKEEGWTPLILHNKSSTKKLKLTMEELHQLALLLTGR